VIANQLEPRGTGSTIDLYGSVEFNGEPLAKISSAMPRMVGYVKQEHSLLLFESLHETFAFAAALRIPPDRVEKELPDSDESNDDRDSSDSGSDSGSESIDSMGGAAHPSALPPLESSSASRSIQHVEAALGLTRLADSYIAQLSGGEQKRASIGIELLASPPVLLFGSYCARCNVLCMVAFVFVRFGNFVLAISCVNQTSLPLGWTRLARFS
jgi:ABC-type sugar transport system ATPase subunit